jgi:hypothetical protein
LPGPALRAVDIFADVVVAMNSAGVVVYDGAECKVDDAGVVCSEGMEGAAQMAEMGDMEVVRNGVMRPVCVLVVWACNVLC